MKEVIATGEPVDRPDLAVGIEDIMQLMDYDDMRALERRLLTTDTLGGQIRDGVTSVRQIARAARISP